MLEEHLGMVGRIIALLYIIIFLLVASLYLRIFIDFLTITVLNNTPATLIILCLLIPGVYAVRSGAEVFARTSEVILVVFLPLAIILLLAAATENPDWRNLMPVGFISMRDLTHAVYLNLWHFANVILVLNLAYFSPRREQIPRLLLIFLVVLTVFLSIALLVNIITLGVAITSRSTFPLFEIARSASYAGFIRNTEPLFVSIFMLGIFVSVVSFWIIACYSTQQVFRLKDYRFLAAPSAIIIAFQAVLIAPNTFGVFRILRHSAPLLFGFFFVLIPFLLYILLLFKPELEQKSNSGLQNETES